MHTSLGVHVLPTKTYLECAWDVVIQPLQSSGLWGAIFELKYSLFSGFPSACQCNGHSKCINDSICEKCENLTTGKHCETCISGYYGDPTNGGTCQRKWCFKPSCAQLLDVFCSLLIPLVSNWNYILIIYLFFPASKAQSLFLQMKGAETAW